jgi:hypothetical protein
MRNGLRFVLLALIAFACFYLSAQASDPAFISPTVQPAPTPTAEPTVQILIYSECTYLPLLTE